MSERPVTGRSIRILLAGTGCLGTGPATATPTPTTTPNTDCPPALTVTGVDADQVDPSSAVAYENLTADQRATFDRARNGTAVEGFDYAWRDVDVVEHEDRYYNTGILVC